MADKVYCQHCGKRIVWYLPEDDDDPFGPWWQHKGTSMRHCAYSLDIAEPKEKR